MPKRKKIDQASFPPVTPLYKNKRARFITREILPATTPQYKNKKIKFTDEEISFPVSQPELLGIASIHANLLSTLSKSNEYISIWRPVNPEASYKLQSSSHTGKGLNIKAKSSEFSPLAGEVPFDVRLSKLYRKSRNEQQKYQAKTQDELQIAEAKYRSYQQKGINATNYEEINNELLMTTITKITKREHIVYFFEDIQGNIFHDTSNPYLAIKKEGKWLAYNTENKKYSAEINIPSAYKPREVKIIAYRNFVYDKLSNTLQESIIPVTADYDELCSISRKHFPNSLSDSSEVLHAPFLVKTLFQLAAAQDEEERLNHIVELVLQYEEFEAANAIDIQINPLQPYMGAVNDWQRDVKAYLQKETRGATNHGPEVNNPFPEPFTEGNYPFFLADGRSGLLHDERTICAFINQKRQEGYPLPVNPKWGWRVDEAGDLYVPENKFDWRRVEEELSILHASVESLAENLTPMCQQLGIAATKENIKILTDAAQKSTPEDKTRALKHLHDFIKPSNYLAIIEQYKKYCLRYIKEQMRYEHDQTLYTIKLMLEKKRLEPSLIYAEYYDGFVNTESPEYQIMQTVQLVAKQRQAKNKNKLEDLLIYDQHHDSILDKGSSEYKILQRVQLLAKQKKAESIRQLEDLLIRSIEDFEGYEWEPSIIKQELDTTEEGSHNHIQKSIISFKL